MSTKLSGDRINWCRHHQKPRPMVDTCACGIDIEALCGEFGEMGRFYRLPCHDASKPDIKKSRCDQADFFTKAEVAAQDAEQEEWIKEAERRMLVTVPFVSDLKRRTKAAKQNLSGSTACPVCETGTVQFRCDIYNLHVAMRCSTIDCICWME